MVVALSADPAGKLSKYIYIVFSNLSNIREHEDQIKHLTINNKQLNEKLEVETFESKKYLRHMDCEMEEMRMKLGKRDLEITQIECENKVLKKMIRKYEDLVHGLRVTVRLKKIILN